MRLVLHNVTVVYFPIWTMPSFDCFSDGVYWVIRIIELISLIPACILTFSFCRIVCQTRIFHFNLSILLVSILGQWFECFIARLLIIPYQEGWIAIQDTVMEDKSTGIYQASGKFLPLFIGGFLRTHYLLSVVIGAPCLVIERMWASFCIRTYEKHPRIYISTSMILISHLLSVFLSYELIQWKYSYLQIIPTFAVTFSITLMASDKTTDKTICLSIDNLQVFSILYIYNSIVTKRLERQHRSYGYHFGKRFQAKENLNSLKLVRRLSIVTVIGMLLVSLCISLVASNLVPRGSHRILLEFSEIFMSLNPLYVIPPTVYRIPLWKSKMLQMIPAELRRKFSRAPNVRPLDYRVRRNNEANTYWNQFASSW